MSTRQTLLRAALQVFAERGSDGGSMREIARRSGVNVATAYHHFGSKRDLLLAIFREMFVDVVDYDAAWGPTASDPKETLEALFALSWAYLSVGADVLRLAVAEALKGDPEVMAVFREWQRRGDAQLENQMLRGGLATPKEAKERAWTVRQVIWGVFVEALMQGTLDDEWFAPRARDAASTLIESWR